MAKNLMMGTNAKNTKDSIMSSVIYKDTIDGPKQYEPFDNCGMFTSDGFIGQVHHKRLLNIHGHILVATAYGEDSRLDRIALYVSLLNIAWRYDFRRCIYRIHDHKGNFLVMCDGIPKASNLINICMSVLSNSIMEPNIGFLYNDDEMSVDAKKYIESNKECQDLSAYMYDLVEM